MLYRYPNFLRPMKTFFLSELKYVYLFVLNANEFELCN